MKLDIGQIISIILNPVLILLITPLLLIYKTSNNLTEALIWTAYSLIFMSLFAICLWYCVRKKIFTNLDVSKRQQRPLLFLITFFFALCYLIGLFLLHAPLILFLIIFTIILGIFCASLLNVYVKTSLHVTSITAFVFALILAYGSWYYFLLVLIPLVAWARIRIKRHTFPETIAGAILGSLLSLGVYTFVRFFFYK